jgi:hypothetical protein
MNSESNDGPPTAAGESPNAKKRWSELSAGQQIAIVLAGIAELIVTSIALRDLLRRPARDVKGPKLMWLLALFVQPFGSPLYLMIGRRRRSGDRGSTPGRAS